MVLAGAGVDATAGQARALGGTFARHVGVNDRGDVGEFYISLPDALRMHYHGRIVLALVEAYDLLSAHGLQPTAGELDVKSPPEVGEPVAWQHPRGSPPGHWLPHTKMCFVNFGLHAVWRQQKTGRARRPADDFEL